MKKDSPTTSRLWFTGKAMEVWKLSEWEFENPTYELSCCLTVDWYFEMLGMTVFLNDHRCILAHATEYLKSVTILDQPSVPMEA